MCATTHPQRGFTLIELVMVIVIFVARALTHHNIDEIIAYYLYEHPYPHPQIWPVRPHFLK